MISRMMSTKNESIEATILLSSVVWDGAVSGAISIDSGGKRAVQSAAGGEGAMSTILPRTGQYYVEVVATGSRSHGIGISKAGLFTGYRTGAYYPSYTNYNGGLSIGYLGWNGYVRNSSGGSFLMSTFGTAVTVKMAIDMDSGKIWFAKNGVFSGTPFVSGEATVFPTGVDYVVHCSQDSSGTFTYTLNV